MLMGLKTAGKAILMVIFFAFMLAPYCEAVKVEGKLYNKNFELLKNVVVEINTNPKQTFISKDGYYSFTMTSGRYSLIAYYKDKNNSVLYNMVEVMLPSAGTYNVDIFVDQPYIGIDVPTQLTEKKIFSILPYVLMIVIFFFVLIVSVLVYFLIRKRKHRQPSASEEKSDIEEFILAIKESGGRITQKELRIKFPKYSEAKVSLVVTELESKGRVEKIKKGRGNVIILKNGI